MDYSKIIDDSFFNAATMDIPITIAMTVASNALIATPLGWQALAGKIAINTFFVGTAAVYGGLISNSASEYFEEGSLPYYVGNTLGGAIKYGIKGGWQLEEVISGAINSFSYSYLDKETFGGNTGKVLHIEAMQETWFLSGMIALLVPSQSAEINTLKVVATIVPTAIIAGNIYLKELHNNGHETQQELIFTDGEL
jgi:hypothetical protein